MKTHFLALSVLCLASLSTTRAGYTANADDASLLPAESPAMCYDTARRIEEMPACKGRVLELFHGCARIMTADGVKFWIGSPAATSDVVRFVETLREGQEYQFPGKFTDWQRGEAQASRAVQFAFLSFQPAGWLGAVVSAQPK